MGFLHTGGLNTGSGNTYFADTNSHSILKLDSRGIFTRIAGDGTAGFRGDGGAAVHARLNNPMGLAADRHGNLYIADMWNHRVRMITPEGLIYTIAGSGRRGFSGDGGPALKADLSLPRGVAVSPNGDLYLADAGSNAVRKLSWSPPELAAIAVDNAASLRPGPLVPEMIAVLRGADLAGKPAETPAGISHTTLEGVSLFVRDSGGVEKPASLVSLSSAAIVFVAPQGLAPGRALLRLVTLDGAASQAAVQVEPSAPGLFTASRPGLRVPLAEIERTSPEGEPARQPVYDCTAGSDPCTPVRIEFAEAEESLRLILTGTGFRGAATLAAVIGETPLEILSYGPHAQEGVDRLVVELPRSLAGSGPATFWLTVDGKTANPVDLLF